MSLSCSWRWGVVWTLKLPMHLQGADMDSSRQESKSEMRKAGVYVGLSKIDYTDILVGPCLPAKRNGDPLSLPSLTVPVLHLRHTCLLSPSKVMLRLGTTSALQLGELRIRSHLAVRLYPLTPPAHLLWSQQVWHRRPSGTDSLNTLFAAVSTFASPPHGHLPSLQPE